MALYLKMERPSGPRTVRRGGPGFESPRRLEGSL